jgi:Ca2+-binding EF-hand superfamily protein
MTFEELMQYAQFFFSQRENNEGLAYIFQLLDSQHKGFITKA